MSHIQLIIDDRERSLFSHFTHELAGINYKIQRINVGDFAIVDTETGQILAVFERKTHEDFAASIKDGRHANKNKMLALRESTGCRVIYICEGALNPNPAKRFGKISFAHIESAIIHLMIRDNIQVIYPSGTLETVRMLRRWVISLQNLVAKTDIPDISEDKIAEIIGGNDCGRNDHVDADTLTDNTTESTDEITNGKEECEDSPADNTPTKIANDISLLNQKQEKNTVDIVREMWAKVRGLTVNNADIFIERWTILEFITGKISEKELAAVRNYAGKALNKRLIKSLMNVDSKLIINIIACVPLISQTMAALIYNNVFLATCLITAGNIEQKNDIDSRFRNIADTKYGATRSKRIGEKRTNKLIECLTFTLRS